MLSVLCRHCFITNKAFSLIGPWSTSQSEDMTLNLITNTVKKQEDVLRCIHSTSDENKYVLIFFLFVFCFLFNYGFCLIFFLVLPPPLLFLICIIIFILHLLYFQLLFYYWVSHFLLLSGNKSDLKGLMLLYLMHWYWVWNKAKLRYSSGQR